MACRGAILGLLAMAACGADDTWEKVLLLQKVKRHVAEAVRQMPDYTCLQTSARYRKGRLSDTVVLEVLNSGDKELYASPGERSFQADSPTAVAGHGLSGTGAFALFLRTLFVNDTESFTWRGEEQYRGRKALRWDYRVPITMSGYTMKFGYAEGRVGMRGWVLVDAETLDLAQLMVAASDVPPNLPLVSATQAIDYAPARIADRDVVLPQSAVIRMTDESGEIRNAVEFTHCQAFRVQSTLSFAEAVGAPVKVSPPEAVRPIGEGLTIAIELVGPVTEQHTVGALIEGRVAAAVLERRKVVIPAGVAVRGRVRRLDREDYQWVVGLEFTEIETSAGPARFYAVWQGLENRGIWTGVPPGVAMILTPKLPLPAGFRISWRTTSPQSASR